MKNTILLLLVLIIGCTKPNVPDWTIVQHYEGDTWQDNNNNDRLSDLMDTKKNWDTYTFEFSERAMYRLERPNGHGTYLGFNKILGTYAFWDWALRGIFSGEFNPVHWNSLRIVWRYDADKDHFELANYWYRDGKRGWEILDTLYTDVPETIEFHKKYGSKCYAYFGGIYPAPHYIEYKLK